MKGDSNSPSTTSSSGSMDCQYWKRGYCVADKDCKFIHDEAKGGQLQDSYLSQINVQKQKSISGSNSAQTSSPTQTPIVPKPSYGPYGFAHPSALASAFYGGGQPVMLGYGYYGQSQMMVGMPIGAQPLLATSAAPKNYKTLPCRHFQRGHCMRGAACGFRHGEEEGGQPPSQEYGLLPAELSHPVHPGRPFRVVTCRRWAQGNCSLGDKCTFRHDFENQPDFGSYNQSSVSGYKRTLSPARVGGHNENDVVNARIEKVQKLDRE